MGWGRRMDLGDGVKGNRKKKMAMARRENFESFCWVSR
jgi:hypothetical protein